MKDNAISGLYRKKIERSSKEEQEFGPGKRDFVICSDCDATYYQKSWHHSFVDYKHLTENKAINFTVCPACQMIKDNKYEGKVVFENVPEQYKDDILRNINNTGEGEYQRDPMDRIIAINNQQATIEITTTENQLARNIARQVKRAYKNIKSEVIWSKDESAAVIIVRF